MTALPRLVGLIPPPAIVALIAAMMWLTQRYSPTASLDLPGRSVAAALVAAAGLGLIIRAAICFRRARTTVNPLAPDRASSLVTAGPYRFSRNPMYVGDAALLLAWAIQLAAPVNAIWLALFVVCLDRLQIPREEAALAARFGRSYAAYRERVRRWL